MVHTWSMRLIQSDTAMLYQFFQRWSQKRQEDARLVFLIWVSQLSLHRLSLKSRERLVLPHHLSQQPCESIQVTITWVLQREAHKRLKKREREHVNQRWRSSHPTVHPHPLTVIRYTRKYIFCRDHANLTISYFLRPTQSIVHGYWTNLTKPFPNYCCCSFILTKDWTIWKRDCNAHLTWFPSSYQV